MTITNEVSPTRVQQRQKVSPVRQEQPTIRKKSNTERPKVFRPFLNESFLRSSIQVEVDHQEFSILKTLSTGDFSKIYLARPELGACKRSLEQALVLKAFRSETTSEEEFFSELETNYFLSPHPNIITSFNVPFGWDGFRIFPLEHAPHGDLSRFIRKESPMPEGQVKAIATQLGAALDFMHSLKLVHRNVAPENVLVFAKDCSLVKLSDFGATVPARTLLTKTSKESGGLGGSEVTNVDETNSGTTKNNRSRSNSVTGGASGGERVKYLPPEICGILPQEKYHCYSSIDVWQLGILIFACITGGGCPWKMADSVRDPGFSHYCDWLKKRCCMKTPLAFQAFSPRFTRLMKRMLEPKPTKRCKILEVTKYLKDVWLLDSSGESSKSNFLLGGVGGGTGFLTKSPSFSGLLQLVTRSNSEIVSSAPKKEPLSRATTCKKSNSLSVRRNKSGGRGGGCGRVAQSTCDQICPRKEPVFRICCKFQCKNQPPVKA